MRLIEFIFSGFWVWLGFVVLVSLVGKYAVDTIKAARVPKKVTAYRAGDRLHIELSGARLDREIKAIMSDKNTTITEE